MVLKDSISRMVTSVKDEHQRRFRRPVTAVCRFILQFSLAIELALLFTIKVWYALIVKSIRRNNHRTGTTTILVPEQSVL